MVRPQSGATESREAMNRSYSALYRSCFSMENAETKLRTEKENAKEAKAQIDELLSWAECFDKADVGTRHLIIARLIERVEVSSGHKIHIKFRISLEQYMGKASA
jgi:hypothetical protein